MQFTKQEYNNKECYLIELSKDYKIWVEKETGIVIREMDIAHITNRTYTFDVVKDEIHGLDSVPVGVEKNTLKISKFDFFSKIIYNIYRKLRKKLQTHWLRM